MDEKFQKIRYGSFSAELEEVSCPICSVQPKSKVIFQEKNGVKILQCLRCNILYASTRFTEESLLKLYEHNENNAFMDFSYFDSWSYDEWEKKKDSLYIVSYLKTLLVKSYLSKGSKILDVGCATGLFCYEAMRQGFDVTGIDPSKMLTDIGRDVLKLDLYNCGIENFNPKHKFDGIVIWDVLEHVYNPISILKKCYGLLNSGGYLFLQVPNHKGISNVLKTFLCKLGIKSDFSHFGFPYHIYSFDIKSMSMLLKTAGFVPLRFESWSRQLKDGKKDLLSCLSISFFKKTCLSDYIVCVAKKS